MSKPIIQKVTSKSAVIIYQQLDEGVGEPALLVEHFSDSVSITQGDDCVLVNKETILALCAHLKTAVG